MEKVHRLIPLAFASTCRRIEQIRSTSNREVYRPAPIAIPAYGPPLTYCDKHTARHLAPPTLQLRMAVRLRCRDSLVDAPPATVMLLLNLFIVVCTRAMV